MLEIFTALGMPAGTVSTADTPRRFLRAIFDATSGYEGDEKLVTAFPTECRGGLAAAYDGDIGFAEPCTYANFVASLDEVTALGRSIRLPGRRSAATSRPTGS
jgi:hypothetical protein